MSLSTFPGLWPAPLRPDYPQRAEPRPCAACGQPIVPGQLYAVRGPLHIGCGRKGVTP